jgi:diadenosine tetraphosphate (Ap4A) HIT family hydrolase
MMNTVKQILMEKFNPDGFNVGINVNEEAGQTIPHVHIHLIPRYRGDVKDL